MLGTNGHEHVSAYVRAYVRACVCLWVADGRGKKAVVSGGVCVYKYMCVCVYVHEVYTFSARMLLLLIMFV